MIEVCPKLSIMIYLSCVLEVHLDMRRRIGRKKRKKDESSQMGKTKSREI